MDLATKIGFEEDSSTNSPVQKSGVADPPIVPHMAHEKSMSSDAQQSSRSGHYGSISSIESGRPMICNTDQSQRPSHQQSYVASDYNAVSNEPSTEASNEASNALAKYWIQPNQPAAQTTSALEAQFFTMDGNGHPSHFTNPIMYDESGFMKVDEFQRNLLASNPTAIGTNIDSSSNPARTVINNGSSYGDISSVIQYGMPSPQSQAGWSLTPANPHTNLGTNPITNSITNPSRNPTTNPPNIGVIGQSRPIGLQGRFMTPDGRFDLPTPSSSVYIRRHVSASVDDLRYPVLESILPHIACLIPRALACDLLELYFKSSSTAYIKPASPYVSTFILRKWSVLRTNNPRPCSKALLCSMLWVAAQTSDSKYLTAPPARRGRITKQLLELTISFLNPLVHSVLKTSENPSLKQPNDVSALGDFGMANPAAGNETEGGSASSVANLDDVITYINIAHVISASEYKASSMRWWTAANCLARELRLGKELGLPGNDNENTCTTRFRMDNDEESLLKHESDRFDHTRTRLHPNTNLPDSMTEEQREERRRTWWLLFLMDRHLSLCYNLPLSLLDAECQDLLQPIGDAVWQAGEFFNPTRDETWNTRQAGPRYECTGHSLFGCCLPLFTILGSIINMQKAKQHPVLGPSLYNSPEWTEQIQVITHQLEEYTTSLHALEVRSIVPPQSTREEFAHTSPIFSQSKHQIDNSELRTRIIVAYGRHFIHVLYVLLYGKWDAISLLDNTDNFIASPAFSTATSHAIAAAGALNDILEYDPDLSFMPYFFGIYLLQGSFLLLLIADKMGTQADDNAVKACETIVRAHEVCVVTLNTEYQASLFLLHDFVNESKLMLF